MKLIVTAGGTLGHINPALAIINYYKKQEKNLEVLYIGTHNRMEKDIVPEQRIVYKAIEVYGFSKDMSKNIKNFFCIKKAYKECLKIMDEFKPDLVIGCGGYVTYPVIKAAHKRNKKIFIHEQNIFPGKSNKMIASFADLIGITFETSKNYFKKAKKIVYTGHPSAAVALETKKIDKISLGFKKGKKLVVITAGSLGSFTLNERIYEAILNYPNSNVEFLIITGKDNYDSFMKDKKLPNHIKVLPFINPLTGILKDANLVISRAGAATICEIITLQIPSIIIPSPFVANNHQYYTAKELSDKKAILMLEEKDISKDSFVNLLESTLNSKEKQLDLIHHMQELNMKDSSKIIYDLTKKL